jgi:excisionase family DNA binding protein
MEAATYERLTMSVEEAARLLGVGRNNAYVAARRGDIPTIRIGKRILVLREPLKRMLEGEPNRTEEVSWK